MNPEELKRKWGEIAAHLQVNDHGEALSWKRPGVECQLLKADDTITYTEISSLTTGEVAKYQWPGLSDIGWLTENRVSLVFRKHGCKTVVVLHKDKSPEIDGAKVVARQPEVTAS
jgi:hypothetical protein